jgi:hypothetical protein
MIQGRRFLDLMKLSRSSIFRVLLQRTAGAVLVCFGAFAHGAILSEADLEHRFNREVRPFVENYCLNCHDNDDPKADLDLSVYKSMEAVVRNQVHWELVLERLRNGDMPPAKSKKRPAPELRKTIVGWIEAVRESEAEKHAGDPGPVPARRLSNAEYDYTIRDLTGVDIRPTRAFPVDPANQAGFDNSAESLAMSPALVTKYLQAAREVADHLALTPDGFTFAPHPVIADTDRDKWAVFRIVDFYRRQPTDYADYFLAAWRYQHRAALGSPASSLHDVAIASAVSPKYLALIWSTLTSPHEEVGPIAKLQSMWRVLPEPNAASLDEVRGSCLEMREWITRVRDRIVPVVKNLNSPPIQSGSQTLVLWKNRQMAANRRRFDPAMLLTSSSLTNETADARNTELKKADATNQQTRTNQYGNRRGRTNHVQAPTPDIVKKGGFALPPALLTTNSSATAKLAALKNKAFDPDLLVPDEAAERAHYEAAFARFADVFPDAFYITERARVYLDAEKEQENAGRLLSAGLHSMTGYFRDDQPLYDLILDENGQRELDRLWEEFDFLSSVPQRMHTSFVWFERTDSAYMRDAVFDPYRPEDKSVTRPEKIRGLAELYLAKAKRNNASETVQAAIQEHFEIVTKNIARVEQQRRNAVPSHLKDLESFAERAYRRPLKAAERKDLRDFYEASRQENGIEHEDAMRDCIVRVLMAPNFLFRMDLVEAGGNEKQAARVSARPLSPYALASRLSYFLWASMPDEELAAHAASGDLHKPEVLKAQARRMLRDGRVRNFATEFAGNWLDFRRFEQHNSVDRERYPVFNDALRKAMFEEPIQFFIHVAQSNRSVLDFLYSRETLVNEPLARHYGIPFQGRDSNAWVRVENAREFGRGGLLPMSVFLTANSPGLRTSPVKRGYWVVRRLLGERIPPPPAVVPELPSDEKDLGNLTLRETLAAHRNNEACAGCHARFDSFGLVFESYGPIGERRDRDFGGRPVDTRAEFPNKTERAGLDGLIEYIRESREKDFVDNLCRKLLAYGLGRTLILSDEPLVRQMRSKLAAEDDRLGSLIESIVTSEQFLNKRGQRGDGLAQN